MKKFLKTIFWQKKGSNLRVIWRLFLLAVTIFVVSGLVFIFLEPLLYRFVPEGIFLDETLSAIAFTFSVWFLRRFVERASLQSLGLRWGKRVWQDILAGFFIAFGLMALIFVSESALGWVHLDAFTVQPSTVLSGLALFALVAWNEELLMRGYLLQTLADGMPLLWAVILSSAFFGVAHLGNPNATWASAVGIFLTGIFLAYGYTRTRRLWLPIGLHLGWNFFEGTVFGFPVSGLDLPTLAHIRTSGPALWTGGAFGPEAGLIIVPALALGIALIYFYTRRRA